MTKRQVVKEAVEVLGPGVNPFGSTEASPFGAAQRRESIDLWFVTVKEADQFMVRAVLGDFEGRFAAAIRQVGIGIVVE